MYRYIVYLSCSYLICLFFSVEKELATGYYLIFLCGTCNSTGHKRDHTFAPQGGHRIKALINTASNKVGQVWWCHITERRRHVPVVLLPISVERILSLPGASHKSRLVPLLSTMLPCNNCSTVAFYRKSLKRCKRRNHRVCSYLKAMQGKVVAL